MFMSHTMTVYMLSLKSLIQSPSQVSYLKGSSVNSDSGTDIQKKSIFTTY